MDLTSPPEPLNQRQRTIFLVTALVCAVSRFAAMAKSLWDWDEVLFCLALRDYNVTQHHPHPPGFPVYVGAAKLVRLFVDTDFHAYQAINMVAAMLAFPALFLLARELRVRFPIALLAATLFAFLPNVWFFGGTAFSDIPAIVLVVFAVVFLLRGVRSPRDYFIGTALLALSCGIRGQNILVGIAPGLLASRRRKPMEVVAAALLGAVIVGGAYGAAIRATGSLDGYMAAVRAHGDYISRIDSYQNPARPPLWRITDRFFFKQYQFPPLSVVLSVFVLVSLVGVVRDRARGTLLNIAIFGPFAIFAWLMLDRYSVNRFSLGYVPMFVLLAADGIERVSRGRDRIALAIGGVLTLGSILWTWPALTPVRTEVSPTVFAVEQTVKQFDAVREELFVGFSMTPFVEYFAPQLKFMRVKDDYSLPLTAGSRQPVLLAEVSDDDRRGTVFSRRRGHLWNIARRHYFEVSLARIDALPQFVSGFSGAERDGIDELRWMSRRGVVELPPSQGRNALRLLMYVPAELLPQRPTISVVLNGKLVERFGVTGEEIAREYKVQGTGSANVLELSIDRALPPDATDGRERGLRLRFLSWGRD